MERSLNWKGVAFLAIVAALLCGAAYWIFTKVSDNIDIFAPGGSTAASIEGSEDTIDVCVVTWGGYAGGQYFNRGFAANAESRFTQEYGINVEFHLNDDVNSSLAAFNSGDCDMHWWTLDSFGTIAKGLVDAGLDPVVVFQSDWSRGGDAIVVGPGISSVADLRGRSVAVAEGTPSHTFLLQMLASAGMSESDVNVTYTTDAIKAGDAFRTGSVDAAVVWSPDDILLPGEVTGASVLVNTRTASHIIADVFFARRDFVEQNRDDVQRLVEGWMRGAAEINTNASAKNEAAQILQAAFALPTLDDAVAMIDNVRLTTYGDNQAFFGIEGSVPKNGAQLYSESNGLFQRNGRSDLVDGAPSWRQISYPGIISSISLSGSEHAGEGQFAFSAADSATANAAAISTRALSVQFATGSATLTPEARATITREFVPTAQAMAGARIRIEGNTDNTGSRTANIALSQRRAQAVADFLADFGFDRNRFVVVGNGPDEPVCGSQDAQCLAQNRRTDFELLSQ